MDCHNKYRKFSTEVPWGVSDELLVEEEEKEGGKWFCYWIAFTVKNTATPDFEFVDGGCSVRDLKCLPAPNGW